MDSNTKVALEILAKLVMNETINDKENKDLYKIIQTNYSVVNELQEMVELYELELYITDAAGIFIIPKINNKVFGYTNEELRHKLNVKNNKELYLSYFSIYCVISTFYIQSNYRTQVEYIDAKSLLNKVENRLRVLSNNADILSQKDFSFSEMYNYWTNEINESSSKNKERVDFSEKRGKTRIALINKTLLFLVDHQYMYKDEYTDRYSISKKFEYIIERFFDDVNTKTVLQELIDEEIEDLRRDLNA